MKPVKRIPFIIFVTVLVAGIIGVVGMSILKYDIDNLSKNYKQISDVHFVNKESITHLSNLIYNHQSVTAEYAIATTSVEQYKYEEKEKKLKEQITQTLSDLGDRMKEEKYQALYHKVYSNTFIYLSNSDNVFTLLKSDSNETANYYISTVMSGYIDTINEDLDDLTRITESDMEDANERMNYYIGLSQINELVCIAFITASVIISLIICVSNTTTLEKYKDNLEKEIDNKTKELMSHNEKIISIQTNTVIGMASLIENRDGETGEHIKRTSSYVKILAETAMKKGYKPDILNKAYIDLLTRAAPLHDIGKIIIPDNILKKPGKLTAEEFEIMKTHSDQGGRIIREVLVNIEENDYVDIASNIAGYHHEKWNGSGYPDGLK